MTQCATEPAESLILDDPSVAALIAEVDAIRCAADSSDSRQRPTPPATGCALRGPRRAGWSCQKRASSLFNRRVRRVDSQQRSPRASNDTERRT